MPIIYGMNKYEKYIENTISYIISHTDRFYLLI